MSRIRYLVALFLATFLVAAAVLFWPSYGPAVVGDGTSPQGSNATAALGSSLNLDWFHRWRNSLLSWHPLSSSSANGIVRSARDLTPWGLAAQRALSEYRARLYSDVVAELKAFDKPHSGTRASL